MRRKKNRKGGRGLESGSCEWLRGDFAMQDAIRGASSGIAIGSFCGGLSLAQKGGGGSARKEKEEGKKGDVQFEASSETLPQGRRHGGRHHPPSPHLY